MEELPIRQVETHIRAGQLVCWLSWLLFVKPSLLMELNHCWYVYILVAGILTYCMYILCHVESGPWTFCMLWHIVSLYILYIMRPTLWLNSHCSYLFTTDKLPTSWQNQGLIVGRFPVEYSRYHPMFGHGISHALWERLFDFVPHLILTCQGIDDKYKPIPSNHDYPIMCYATETQMAY